MDLFRNVFNQYRLSVTFGLIAFALGLIIIEFGFLKTVLIIIIVAIGTLIGYLLDKIYT